MATIISDRRPVSRIARRCDACDCFIDAGTVYVLRYCADGGDRWTWRSHEDCHMASNAYADRFRHMLGPWDSADFLEWLEEERESIPEAAAILARYHEEDDGP